MPNAHPLRRALPLFLLAGLCLSSLDATAKYLVRDHALFLVVWARYAGQMLVVTPFAWQRACSGFWRTRHPVLQLLRSAFLLGATICFFGGLRYLPLAEGSAITFLAPIFVILLSGPLLGERPSLRAGSRRSPDSSAFSSWCGLDRRSSILPHCCSSSRHSATRSIS
ncbi:MAG TPA: DMT family transporter [Casimicrobiaceae bacterium]